ncbi:endonuclease III [Chlamydia sp.]|uniref:endonuclease III domain-containing protein n=1 Tax=Chlamydia sp. TaxID=35827 RepID=UPI0025C4400A|nr:endonuclease III [Chlamydia sp.]MBQ8498807.1 endonuclease III [Chlamydia sp.]
MNKRNALSKLSLILDTLNTYFPSPEASLKGWQSPFQLLIAILLSGNSTDKAVNSVTPRLFTKAPNAELMSKLSLAEIYSLISPCGLGERKATYIQELSRILVERYAQEPPRTLSELIKLPGVGRKTASVFLSIYYGENTFPVDTHILRLAHRWKLSTKRSPSAVEKDLVAFFGPMNSPKLHLQLIYYAREFCPALHHKVETCPICSRLAQYPD